MIRWVALSACVAMLSACGPTQADGPASVAYEVERQDGVIIRNQGGAMAAQVDLIFRAGSGQARGCKATAGASEQVVVGAESELMSVSLKDFRPGQEVRLTCATGTDLRYFRGETSGGRIVPYEEVEEIPFRSSNLLWVVFLSGIAVLMLLSFFLSLLLDRFFGRLGEAA